MLELGTRLGLESELDSDPDSVYWTCSLKAKNQKAKQTIQGKTRNEMQCNAMKKKQKTMNQGE